MFRQILKLKQARKAFKEGRFQEALSLADDPEVKDHLQAKKLRDRALRALAGQVDRHEREGDLSLAVAEIEKLRRWTDDDAVRLHERRLRKQKRDREDDAGRMRQKYYKARLLIDRGDMDGARALLSAISPIERTPEIKELLVEIEQRAKDALRWIGDARSILSADPVQAEELARKAESLHPQAPELAEFYRDLARAKVKLVTDGDLSDGALAAFLLDWRLFKRRHFHSEMTADLVRSEADLVKLLSKRVREHLAAGRYAEAERLIDRQSDVLARDHDLESLGRGLKRLAEAQTAFEQGGYEDAKARLEEAMTLLPRSGHLKELSRSIERARREIQPALEEATRLLRERKLHEAKGLILGILEGAPGHMKAGRLLERINAQWTETLRHLDEARRRVGERRLEAASAALQRLEALGWEDPEVDLLRREIAHLERTKPSIAKPRHELAGDGGKKGPAAFGGAAPRAVAHGGAMGPLWVLGVEEHGEILVVEKSEVLFGSAARGVADLMFMAPLAARHAVLRRRRSFHGGDAYVLESVEGRPVRVNGEDVTSATLKDGDRVALGTKVHFRFHYPSEVSRAPVLQFEEGELVQGLTQAVLLPPTGRAGAIRVGNLVDAHIATSDSSGSCEVYRETAAEGGQLVVQGASGVAVDGDAPRSRAFCRDGSTVRADDLTLVFRSIAPSD
ncbi:MAG TPA: hypothetical protein ENK43_16965 [Planctomycetes bacterium]|nr:hypothetical protein [Planctomycetota bacterium]